MVNSFTENNLHDLNPLVPTILLSRAYAIKLISRMGRVFLILIVINAIAFYRSYTSSGKAKVYHEGQDLD